MGINILTHSSLDSHQKMHMRKEPGPTCFNVTLQCLENAMPPKMELFALFLQKTPNLTLGVFHKIYHCKVTQ